MRGACPSWARRLWKEVGVELDGAVDDAETLAVGTVDFFIVGYTATGCVTADLDVGET